MDITYEIRILNSSLEHIATILNPMELDSQGTILMYSKELDDYGQCKFRISAFDSVLTQYGDILQPHANHLRIMRNGTLVWSGAIVDNTKRTSEFIEVIGAEYEFYLSKILINRSSLDPATGASDNIYRIFNSGTMAAAVTAMIDESIATLTQSTNTASALSGMTVGSIQNPNYPPNMTDDTGTLLTGGWNFTTNLQLQFDFNTILYVIQQMGLYAYADFYIDNNLVFNFVNLFGNNLSQNVNFVFNKTADHSNSNIIDYNLPRLGTRMVNNIYGIATNTNGVILNSPQTDQASVTEYGLFQGVAAYTLINDQGILNARTIAEMPLVSTPQVTNGIVTLNETSAYPLGQWDVGDFVTIQVTNTGITFNEVMRIVGASVNLNSTGREFTTVQTNLPLAWQLALAGTT